MISRRTFTGMLAGLSVPVLHAPMARAAAADADVKAMIAGLQEAKALSFTVQSRSGAAAAGSTLKTLGDRASVVFRRPDSLFAVFGEGGGPDVQLLISGGEATLFRLSLASRTVLKLAPENGAAFAVPGFFIPFLGLTSPDVETDFFGGITSVTPIAQGAAGQAETTTLAAVMGGRFTGEVWIAKDSGRPSQVTGTWFGGSGTVAASAALGFTGWSSAEPVEGAFAVKGLAEAKDVPVDALGL